MSPGGSPSRDDAPRPLDLRIRFERFPATLKGAFVLQGADGNPHAVRLEWARITRVPGDPVSQVPVEHDQVDVAPGRNLFLPFEVSVSELSAGWYRIQASARVDAGRAWTYASRPFSIPWPRSEIRRGTIRVDRTIGLGQERFSVDRLELSADMATVVWRMEG